MKGINLIFGLLLAVGATGGYFHDVAPLIQAADSRHCIIVGHFVSVASGPDNGKLVTLRRRGALVVVSVTEHQWLELGMPQVGDLLAVELPCGFEK